MDNKNIKSTTEDLISREEVLKSILTYDKFACLSNGKLEPFRNLDNPEDFVPYVHLDEIIECIKQIKGVNK